MPAGSTRVTVTLLGDEDGPTRLTLRHENLPSDSLREGHDIAWKTYLPRLAVRAAGRDPGPDPHADRSPAADGDGTVGAPGWCVTCAGLDRGHRSPGPTCVSRGQPRMATPKRNWDC